MGAGNQLQSVYVAEIICHLRTEDPSGTTGIDCPIFDILRVRPHEIAERTFMGDFNLAVNGPHLVNCLDFGAESSVDAEDLACII